MLVTVWAQEQENPKKLAKWQEIPEPSDNRSGNQTGGVLESTPPQCIADSDGGDYFVPWHLPFHRTEAVAVLDSMTRRSQVFTLPSLRSPGREGLLDQSEDMKGIVAARPHSLYGAASY